MKLTKTGINRAIAIVSPALAAVLTVLVQQNVMSSTLAAGIATIFTALAAGWGGNVATTKVEEKRAAKAAG